MIVGRGWYEYVLVILLICIYPEGVWSLDIVVNA